MSEVFDIQQQWFDSFGSFAIAGKVYYGKPNTNPKTIANQIDVFSDRALTPETRLPNPQTIGIGGRVENKPWLNERYSIQVDDSEGVSIFTSQDNGENPTTGGVTLALSNIQGINNITADSGAGLTALADLQEFSFVAVATNTDDMTLSVDGITAKAIKFNFTEQLGKGFIQNGQTVNLIYSLSEDIFSWTNEGRGISLLVSVGGTADAITASGGPSESANIDKHLYIFKASADNTGAVTLAIDSITAASIKYRGAELVANDFKTGQLIVLVYDSATDIFNLISPTPNQFLLQSKMCIPFFDVAENIPAGFVLCDGNNGTPDFTEGQYPRAANATGSDIGETGGSTITGSHTLTNAQVPSHDHDYNDTISTTSLQSGNVTNINVGSQTAQTVSSGGGGGHTHPDTEPPFVKILWIMKI